MPFSSVEKVTVSSGQPLVLPDGSWMQGKLIFTAPDLAVIGAQDVTLGGSVEAPLVDGEFSVQLVATDASGMNPAGWTYKVTAMLTNAPDWIQYVLLPKVTASVKLADVIVPAPVSGTYAALIDPATIATLLGLAGAAIGTDVLAAQVTGDVYKRLILNAGGGFDLGPGSGPVDTNLYRGDVGLLQTDGALAVGEWLSIGGVVISGTPAAGDVLTAISATEAAWMAPSAGGGSAIRSSVTLIADDAALTALPDAAVWTVAQTPAGTKMQGSIRADEFDRLLICPNFAWVGSGHFLDVVKVGTGGISFFATTRTSTPAEQGSVLYYPNPPISHAAGPRIATVAASDIDGSGHVTVGLAHIGSGDMKIYSHPIYPCEVLVLNIGPEPA